MPIACNTDRRCASASMTTALERRQIRIERRENLIDRGTERADARFDVDITRGFLGPVGFLQDRLTLILVHTQLQRHDDYETGIALDALVAHDLAVDAQCRRARG